MIYVVTLNIEPAVSTSKNKTKSFQFYVYLLSKEMVLVVRSLLPTFLPPRSHTSLFIPLIPPLPPFFIFGLSALRQYRLDM